MLSLITEEQVVKLLKALVQIPSPNPGVGQGQEKNLSDYIYSILKEWGLDVEQFDVFPGRPSVAGVLKGVDGNPILVLNGHLDHIPPGDLKDWSVDPYGAEIRDGRLYGRGSTDMKAGLTAMMIATKAIIDANIRLRGNMILTFGIGEETGERGTKHIVVDKKYVGDWGIVTEPTEYQGRLKVATAEKGQVIFTVTVKGKAIHSSRATEGVNAILKANKAINALEKYNQDLKRRLHPLLGVGLCTVTRIQGGLEGGESMVPDSCIITVDRRMLPGETVENVRKELEHILEKIKEEDLVFKYELERARYFFEAVEIPADSEIAKTVRRNLKKVTGYDSEPWGTPYSSDVRNLINDARIPSITFGPGDITRTHCVDEYVEIRKVVDAAKVIVLTALDLLGTL